MKKNIIITCSTPWVLKNLIHTGLLSKLSKFKRISILTTEKYYQDIRKEFENNSSVDVILYDFPREPLFLKLCRVMFRCSLQRLYRLDKEMEKGLRLENQFVKLIIYSITKFTMINTLVNKLTAIFLYRKRVICDLDNSDCLLVTSPFSVEEFYFSNSITNIENVYALIPSWDNLTTKGIISDSYDGIFLWGSVTSDTLKKLYPTYTDDNVFITGVPQFDVYDKKKKPSSHKNYVLYCTSGAHIYPGEQCLVLELIQYCLKNGVKIKVKLHPNDSLDRFNNCREYSDLFITSSSNLHGIEGWIPDKNSNYQLEQLFNQSFVSISMASTIMLDSLANNVPTISIRIESKESNLASYYEYDHLKTFFDISSVPIVDSFSELTRLIESYNENHSRCFDYTNVKNHYFPNLGNSVNDIVRILGEL